MLECSKGERRLGRFICSRAELQFQYFYLHHIMGLALLALVAFWGRCMVHHGTAEPASRLYQPRVWRTDAALLDKHVSDGLAASPRRFPPNRAAQLSRTSCIFVRDARQQNLLRFLFQGRAWGVVRPH